MCKLFIRFQFIQIAVDCQCKINTKLTLFFTVILTIWIEKDKIIKITFCLQPLLQTRWWMRFLLYLWLWLRIQNIISFSMYWDRTYLISQKDGETNLIRLYSLCISLKIYAQIRICWYFSMGKFTIKMKQKSHPNTPSVKKFSINYWQVFSHHIYYYNARFRLFVYLFLMNEA